MVPATYPLRQRGDLWRRKKKQKLFMFAPAFLSESIAESESERGSIKFLSFRPQPHPLSEQKIFHEAEPCGLGSGLLRNGLFCYGQTFFVGGHVLYKFTKTTCIIGACNTAIPRCTRIL